MATIVTLEAEGHLHRLDLELRPGELPARLVYVTGEFTRWVEHELAVIESGWVGYDVTPYEQLHELMAAFVSGAPLAIGRQFRRLRPLADAHGVWELKTADLRVFGWFYRRDLFIAARGSSAEKVKRYNLYAGYRDEVRRLRDALDLDAPKYLVGRQPDDVVSFAY